MCAREQQTQVVHTGIVSPASMPRPLSPVVHVYASMQLEAEHTPFNTLNQLRAAPPLPART